MPTNNGKNSSCMASPSQKLALYTHTDTAQIVVLDYSILPHDASPQFAVAQFYKYRSNGTRGPLKAKIVSLSDPDLFVIEAVPTVDFAAIEFVYTFNYIHAGHDADVDMRRQLAMIWRYLVYDTATHTFKAPYTLIVSDAQTIFENVHGGAFCGSTPAAKVFTKSKVRPSTILKLLK